MFEARKVFNKPALSLDEQLKLLTSRGLNVCDIEKAKHYLKFIGYYRLSAYCLPFQNRDPSDPHHQFKIGTNFEDILNLYIFDRKLRLLVMDAIEQIEVAVKAAMSNILSEEDGSHWFMSPKHFNSNFDHTKFIEKIKEDIKYDHKYANKREIFIKHYYNKYHSPELPPCWMVFETLSFGTVSYIFKSLELESKKKIAKTFNLGNSIMQSWLHAISYLRNLCAHHSRLWNRTFTIKPITAKSYKEYLCENDRFYAQAVVVEVFLKTIAKSVVWLRAFNIFS